MHKVHQFGSEGVELLCGAHTLRLGSEEAGEELRSEASCEDFVEGFERWRVQSDREGGALANFVLHGANGFIEGMDDKVDCTRANDVTNVIGILVDRERDGSGDVGGDGKCSSGG
jgi:hypothetical protein